jgi:hypothetical protein
MTRTHRRRQSSLALVLWLLCAPASAQDLDLDAELEGDFGGDDEASDSSESASQSESDSDSESGSESDSESDSESASETESASDSESDSDSASEPGTEPDTESAITVQVILGAGIGTRSFLRPTLMGPQRLDDALFPALDTGLAVQLWPAESVSLGLRLSYQSSLGLEIRQPPPFAIPNEIGARAERVELSFAPTFRLGDARDSIALAFPIGFGMRTLWPEAHEFPLVGYSLAGPQLRIELIVPFSDSLRLRIGPELLWAVALDQTLQDQGVASQAIALGGEAAIGVQLGAVLGLELSYRESHGFASTTRTTALFEDVERFATLRLLGSL